MRDVLPDLLGWWRSGEDVALATVVGTWQSAPRQAGASMLVGPDGSVVGSVSGGCVEADVYAVAEQVLSDGRPTLRRYGVGDADALAVGLTCGGVIDVFVQRLNRNTFPELDLVAQAVDEQHPIAVATTIRHLDPDRVGTRLVIEDDPTSGTLGNPRLDQAVAGDVAGLLANGRSDTLHYGPDGECRGQDVQVFVECFAPPPRLLVFGANDFAAAVAKLGRFLGYRVTVCDARPIFATRARFPDADDVIIDWPHRYLQAEAAAGRTDARTAVCVLTHDPKFDVPLLSTALRMPAVGFVGAMGSRRTHQERLNRLAEQGLSPEQLAQLSSPVGLDLGARTPEETAVSIMAEIIATQWGGSGTRLADTNRPIHHTTPDTPTTTTRRRGSGRAGDAAQGRALTTHHPVRAPEGKRR